MAATKKMVVRVIRDEQNDLRFTVPQTRANLAILTDAFGEAHEIHPRNVWGRAGKPQSVKDAEAKAAKVAADAKKAAKPTVKKSTPKAKKTSTPAAVPTPAV